MVDLELGCLEEEAFEYMRNMTTCMTLMEYVTHAAVAFPNVKLSQFHSRTEGRTISIFLLMQNA